MFSPFERMMAGRYLRARKAEGFVSIIAAFSFIGIMLGVAILIIVMAVMNGFRQELITQILGLNGHLNVYAPGRQAIYDYPSLVKQIEDIDGVELVAPLIEGQVLVSIKGAATGSIVRGISQQSLRDKTALSSKITAGSPDDFTGNNVAIGDNMAQRLNLRIGDQFVILAPKGKVTPFGTIPKSRTLTVGIIFDTGKYAYDNGFIFMPLEPAQRFFQLEGAVKSLEVMARSTDLVPEIKRAIQMRLSSRISVYDWEQENQDFLGTLVVERNVMFLILTLIILIASFNIISSMIMLVKDKGKDIAIMRTMGATRGTITRIFILTGASIGVSGTAAGAILGISFAANIESIKDVLESMTGWQLWVEEIRFLSQIPSVIDWSEVISTIAIALALSIAATLYPAIRAARLDPVEALRYE